MTHPTSPPQEPFIERLVLLLTPYFLAVAPDPETRRAEILNTLAAYGPRTRAEYLQAAQIVAFGLNTLELLVQAETADLSPNQRLRTRSCANALHRSAQRAEAALRGSLACDIPDAASPPPSSLADTETDAAPATPCQPPRAEPAPSMNRLKPRPHPYQPSGQRRSDSSLAHLFAAMAEPPGLATSG